MTAEPTATVTTPASSKTVFGACYYDFFYRLLKSDTLDNKPYDRLKPLRDAGISVVRFSASPYWPNDWNIYDETPDAYLSRLDRTIAAAETLGVSLIPSLVWNPAGLSDHFGERASSLGRSDSRTNLFLQSYIPMIVKRYAGSSAIMIWECSNELNSFADMPNSELYWPNVDATRGTFASRTSDDRITTADVSYFYSQFANLVRGTGDKRPISMGSNTPRLDQISDGLGSTAIDTVDQFKTALQLCLAGSPEYLSVHIYADELARRFGRSDVTYAELLQIAQQVATSAGAKLLVGEFGVKDSGVLAADQAGFDGMIAAIKSASPAYATFWNYDYGVDGWTVTTTNSRSWMLTDIASANTSI